MTKHDDSCMIYTEVVLLKDDLRVERVNPVQIVVKSILLFTIKLILFNF